MNVYTEHHCNAWSKLSRESCPDPGEWERVQLQLFISTQMAAQLQRSPKQWGWGHDSSPAMRARNHTLPQGCRLGPGQLTPAVWARKFISFCFLVALPLLSLINECLEKSMLLFKLLFSISSCLNRQSQTAPGIIKSCFRTANQAFSETWQLRFVIKISPSRNLCLTKEKQNWSCLKET